MNYYKLEQIAHILGEKEDNNVCMLVEIAKVCIGNSFEDDVDGLNKYYVLFEQLETFLIKNPNFENKQLIKACLNLIDQYFKAIFGQNWKKIGVEIWASAHHLDSLQTGLCPLLDGDAAALICDNYSHWKSTPQLNKWVDKFGLFELERIAGR